MPTIMEETVITERAEARKVVIREPNEIEIIKLAEQMGYCCVPLEQYKKEFVHSIKMRLRHQLGEDVYQNTAWDLNSFPRRAIEQLLPEEMKTEEKGVLTWNAKTPTTVASLLGELLTSQKVKGCAGVTRALKTKSETAVRVVASIMTLKITHCKVSGKDRLYFNMTYTLVDHSGTLHPPKDTKGREMELEPDLEHDIRATILTDIARLVTIGVPMSAAFIARLPGMTEADAEARAQELAAAPKWCLRQPRGPRKASSSSRRRGGRRRKLGAESSSDSSESEDESSEAESAGEEQETYAIDCILREVKEKGKRWWVVRWAGYDPAWETWRKPLYPGHDPGAPGGPVETWADWSDLKDTAALQEWQRRAEA